MDLNKLNNAYIDYLALLILIMKRNLDIHIYNIIILHNKIMDLVENYIKISIITKYDFANITNFFSKITFKAVHWLKPMIQMHI